MSIYYSAISGFGITIDLTPLKETVVVQSCEHPERIGQTFCPVCGLKVGSREETGGIIVTDIIEYFMETKLPKKYQFERIAYDSDQFFIGWAISADRDEFEFVAAPPSLNDVKLVIQGILADLYAEMKTWGYEREIDFYDEAKFGFYLAMPGS